MMLSDWIGLDASSGEWFFVNWASAMTVFILSLFAMICISERVEYGRWPWQW